MEGAREDAAEEEDPDFLRCGMGSMKYEVSMML
jgi:hypothetical protein